LLPALLGPRSGKQEIKMILAPTINQQVLTLPSDLQAEVLELVLLLKQRTTLTTPVETNDGQSPAVATLLVALDKARNQTPIGPWHREELYEIASASPLSNSLFNKVSKVLSTTGTTCNQRACAIRVDSS
jgi:hypothetical protein